MRYPKMYGSKAALSTNSKLQILSSIYAIGRLFVFLFHVQAGSLYNKENQPALMGMNPSLIVWFRKMGFFFNTGCQFESIVTFSETVNAVKARADEGGNEPHRDRAFSSRLNVTQQAALKIN